MAVGQDRSHLTAVVEGTNADLFRRASHYNHARLLVNSHCPCWTLSQISANRLQSPVHRTLRSQWLRATITDTSVVIRASDSDSVNPDYKQEPSMGSYHLKSHSFIYSTDKLLSSYLLYVPGMCWSPGILNDQLGKVPALDVTIWSEGHRQAIIIWGKCSVWGRPQRKLLGN